MFQQVIAIVIIAFFLARLFWQKQKKEVSGNEFLFWLLFWLLAGLAIVFIRSIDAFVAKLGFGASGIDVLTYMGVAVLFYIVFRLRLRYEKIERSLTEVLREVAIKNRKKDL